MGAQGSHLGHLGAQGGHLGAQRGHLGAQGGPFGAQGGHFRPQPDAQRQEMVFGTLALLTHLSMVLFQVSRAAARMGSKLAIAF